MNPAIGTAVRHARLDDASILWRELRHVPASRRMAIATVTIRHSRARSGVLHRAGSGADPPTQPAGTCARIVRPAAVDADRS
jgi:hypothetical protein